MLVQLAPDFLDFLDPDLVGCMRVDVGETVVTLDRHQVLKGAHIVFVNFLAEKLVSDFDI